ncbi:MAG: hypothetical protein JST00_04185 [Deltaproteobacteria bacterium]|nr:hypothetical protein [Deltaproteobacteria bacterium]
MDSKQKPARSSAATRVSAFAALVGLASVVGYVGTQTYRAATDSFVAPIILTPDNDVVIQNKLKMDELGVERTRATAQLEALEDETKAMEKALVRLRNLHETASNAIEWFKRVNSRQMYAGVAEQSALASQRTVLASMAEAQDAIVQRAQANVAAGLGTKAELDKEAQTLRQLRFALLENDRSRAQSDAAMHEIGLAQKSIAARGGAAPMPELLLREDEAVRIEIEILKLEADIRTKAAEKKILKEKLGKLDEIEQQLKGRPIVRAIAQSMEVAFVPYTQIQGVKNGGTVYDCTWGLFNCRSVGTVAELVPGEVVLPDPWGNQARGQYVVLTLQDHEAARSKSLRVRGAPGVAAQERTDVVSAR